MISILLVSHNQLCREMVNSAKMIIGEESFERVDYLELLPTDSAESFQDKVEQKLLQLKSPDGVLLLADLFGGSPCNASTLYCCRLSRSGNESCPLACVSGVNLGMLIEAVFSREYMTLEELKNTCIETGRSGICDTMERFFSA